MEQVLNIALSHLRAGDETSAYKVGSNLAASPVGRKAWLNWAYSLIAFDEAKRA